MKRIVQIVSLLSIILISGNSISAENVQLNINKYLNSNKSVVSESLPATNMLIEIDGNTMYLDETGEFVRNREIYVDGANRYFDSNGYMVRNTLIDDKYFDSNGHMVQSMFLTVGSEKMYFTATGHSAKNIELRVNGVIRYFDADGHMVTSSLIGDKYFDSYGHMAQSMFLTIGNDKMYFTANGHSAKNMELRVDGVIRYFDAEGHMVTSALIDDKYFDSYGRMAQSMFLTVGSEKMYFTANGSSAKNMQLRIDSVLRYFDAEGHMVTSTLIGDKYFDSHGQMVQSMFLTIGRDKMYFTANGHSAKNMELRVDGVIRYFDSDGQMVTSALVGDKYFDSYGQMVESMFLTIGRDKMYFTANGHSAKNMQVRVDGVLRYFDSDGHMVRSTLIDDKYFDSHGKAVQSMLLTIGSDKMYFTASGHSAKNIQLRLDGAVRYFDADGHMVRSKLVGDKYFDSKGEMVQSIYLTINGKGMYFQANGIAAKNTSIRVNGKLIYFDELGHAKPVESNKFPGYTLIDVDGGNLSGNRLKNVVVNVGYGNREYWAFTNEYGQLVKVIADRIILQNEKTELVNSNGRYYDDEAYVPGTELDGYDAGHVIADSLGGVANAYNITPQNSILNRHGDQSYMENNIRAAGGATDFEAIIVYGNSRSSIPTKYIFTYTIKGNKVRDEFLNKNPENSAGNGGTTEDDISHIDTNGNGKVSIKEAKAAGFKMPILRSHWLYKYMTDGDGDGMVGEAA